MRHVLQAGPLNTVFANGEIMVYIFGPSDTRPTSEYPQTSTLDCGYVEQLAKSSRGVSARLPLTTPPTECECRTRSRGFQREVPCRDTIS